MRLSADGEREHGSDLLSTLATKMATKLDSNSLHHSFLTPGPPTRCLRCEWPREGATITSNRLHLDESSLRSLEIKTYLRHRPVSNRTWQASTRQRGWTVLSQLGRGARWVPKEVAPSFGECAKLISGLEGRGGDRSPVGRSHACRFGTGSGHSQGRSRSIHRLTEERAPLSSARV